MDKRVYLLLVLLTLFGGCASTGPATLSVRLGDGSVIRMNVRGLQGRDEAADTARRLNQARIFADVWIDENAIIQSATPQAQSMAQSLTSVLNTAATEFLSAFESASTTRAFDHRRLGHVTLLIQLAEGMVKKKPPAKDRVATELTCEFDPDATMLISSFRDYYSQPIRWTSYHTGDVLHIGVYYFSCQSKQNQNEQVNEWVDVFSDPTKHAVSYHR